MPSELQPARPKVLVGFLGLKIDRGKGSNRWDSWRPTVDACRHDDLEFDRIELLMDNSAHQVKKDIGSVSPTTQVNIHHVPFKDAWDFAEVYAGLRTWIAGMTFDEDQEDYLVHMTTGSHVEQICLFLMAETRRLPARLLQTSPPKRGRGEPGRYTIIDLDLSRYDELAARFETERREGVSFLKAGIETRNAAFNGLMDRIEEIAVASKAPILLSGPTGVGKTQLARRVHELKRRQNQIVGEFVEVNCATLRGDAAMSTLFGHDKGAFTGAVSRRDGLLRTADGGLLFLDEIGELGLDEQTMLLRALEDGIYQPLGSDETVTSSFQLIAGTNRDLMDAVREGEFREDLLARIDLWSFELPRLRDRLEDIEPNLGYELERISADLGRQVRFNRDARTRFLDFATAPDTAWTANFRDFGAAITRLGTLATGGRITTELVDEETARLTRVWTRLAGAGGDAADHELLEATLGDRVHAIDRFDQAQLADVIRVCRTSRSVSEAGRKLFAVSRRAKSSSNDASRLSKYLARHELSWNDVS